jgi:serine phosphatase RsbU (regulator of sigma subunit)
LRVAQGSPNRLPVVVAIVVLAVTAALALISLALYHDNEDRLLRLRVRDAASVLTAAVPRIQTQLASAAELADATGGEVSRFRAFVAPSVGTGREFASVSLWRVTSPSDPMTTVGAHPVLDTMPGAHGFIVHAAHTGRLSVIGLFTPPAFGLGYALAAPGSSRGFVVYAESPLPRSRHTPTQSNSAFADLDYAIYLGRTERPSQLLLTSVKRLPLSGRTARSTVAFGDNALTFVAAARRPLAGTLPRSLPWIIAVVGVILALLGAAVTRRLVQRRRDAERLAAQLDRIAEENRRLYAEQRGIAQTLQHALLPEKMPRIPGAEAGARYEASEHGVDIGGDWYDVIVLDDHRVLLVVGDVSGHGLQAAATMAALRFAIRAYAVERDTPVEILAKLSRLVNVSSTGHLATVLCVVVNVDARELTVTSAGHLPPLLVCDGEGMYLRGHVGLPVGVDRAPTYTSTTVTAPAGATLVAYTDGLVERRGEHLDRGLERLCRAALVNGAGLDEFLERVLADVRSEQAEDDTAIVAFRWLA